MFNFYLVKNRTDIRIRKIQIQIGCIIRLNRLEQGLSQFDLSEKFDSNNTLIGRIERAAGFSGWDKIYKLAQILHIPFEDLFYLKNKKELLEIVSSARNFEKKLTTKKAEYYDNLRREIEKLF